MPTLLERDDIDYFSAGIWKGKQQQKCDTILTSAKQCLWEFSDWWLDL